MNRSRFLIVFAGVALLVFSARAQRPVVQTRFTADPAPMVYHDTVFLYTSHDEDYAPPGMAGFRMKDWLLYTSTDMVNWTDHGAVASLHDFSWVENKENGAWAPQCVERNGKFYLYCPMPSGVGIGVLVADTPYGPFTDPIGKPLITGSQEDIDPTVFIDDDGQAYIYWGNPNLWYAELNGDMVSLAGEPVKDPQVRKTQGQPDRFHYQEGPWVWKHGGRYYLAYASTCCPEGIGYAMAGSPVGPWEYRGYLMPPDTRSTGNHPGIIDYKGRSYVFGFNYALNFALTDRHHERRSVCVAEIAYEPDGTIRELPWWDDGTAVEQVEALDPYRRVEAETIAWSEGVKTARSRRVGQYVTSIHNGDYIRVRSVDFGEGADTFQISAASVSGGEIELRLDTLDGPLIGICDISNTIALNFWETFTARLDRVEGVHDLYLVFGRGMRGELFNLDHWRFGREEEVTE